MPGLSTNPHSLRLEGMPMDIEKSRFNMIEQQIRPWDVLDLDVLDLLAIVKREQYVPEAYRTLAFVDMEIPLPGGQNMLPPRVEARVLQELAVRKHEDVLEVGAGSGYMAALLAHRGRHVTTVDIAPELVAFARDNLARNGVTNVDVVQGDAGQGWGNSLYDVICVSGSVPAVPESLLAQLKVGGRLSIFVGSAPVMEAQLITRVSETEFQTRNLFETYVTPLTGVPAPSQFRF
ncbi:protein-L-isoaspartate O-methyltransferase [Ralstonia solanacearum]|nr:protein-L-isoaspartate O-methyltransferase [Ralstonia solanacearum OE1-1]AST26365.1 protein-L-isoaspartate O-methyltransferase [Ralstonia pseudosolanacearum]AUS41675.1 protein-L-isoaspartate O-methyltransferase [Ralstonia solanacearum]AYA47427.1 protein-L-isoaspartate O-methyltransferase [Ralstonia pseudosolanacearum]MCK4134326.1 protein-L-isoaspartate O-methyltransferase [Ralstonia pseudosolanacearum]